MPLTRSRAQNGGGPNIESPKGEMAADETAETKSSATFRSKLQKFKHESDDTSPIKSQIKRTRSDDAEDGEADVNQKKARKRARSSKSPRISSKYAPPSKYAHLTPLQDILVPNLICVFIGTNPGVRTATAGHAYAHPSNSFWKLVHSSGCTDVRLPPAHDVHLPAWYCLGNTNIVSRPSKDAAELSKSEMAAGTPILDDKFARFRPEAVCIAGKGIWEAVWRWRHGRDMRKDEFKWGWQDEKFNMGKTEQWPGARIYVTTSTSGLSASLRPHEKEEIWRPLGEWVKSRRLERFGVEGRLTKDYEPTADSGVDRVHV